MPLNTPRIRMILKVKNQKLTLWSDTRSISSQSASPESCTRVLGCTCGWGRDGPRCCTPTSAPTSGDGMGRGGPELGVHKWGGFHPLASRLYGESPLFPQVSPDHARYRELAPAPGPVVFFHAPKAENVLVSSWEGVEKLLNFSSANFSNYL